MAKYNGATQIVLRSTLYRGFCTRQFVRLVRYSENYVVADYVIVRKSSAQLMLFPQGLSQFVRYSEVYVIAGVVIARSDLYNVECSTAGVCCIQCELSDMFTYSI